MTDPTIHPTRLYSSAELRALIGPTLFERIAPHTAACRDRYWGRHIIAAMDALVPAPAIPAAPVAPTIPLAIPTHPEPNQPPVPAAPPVPSPAPPRPASTPTPATPKRTRFPRVIPDPEAHRKNLDQILRARR